MLSILVPIFNFDVRNFVEDLSNQSKAANIVFEIICFDDGSSDHFKEINKSISAIEGVNYQELPSNIGRSKIRNALAKAAIHGNLLFVDCDSHIPNKDYIRSYHSRFDNYDLVYGGRTYQSTKPENGAELLRWKYGIRREQVHAKSRSQKPFKSFMTNNFIVRKSVYDQIRMNEDIKGYGHEDTAFAMELKKNNFKIEHIDNPLDHTGLETAEDFLEKTINGMKNLAQLIDLGAVDEDIKIIAFYKKLRPLKWFILPCLVALRSTFKNNLLGSNPSLKMLDGYKLGYLMEFHN